MLTSPAPPPAGSRGADAREEGTDTPALCEVAVRPETMERPPAKEEEDWRKPSVVLHRDSADSAAHKVRAIAVLGMLLEVLSWVKRV